eukprot:341846-Pelagomonas_calceolata.AAC.2
MSKLSHLVTVNILHVDTGDRAILHSMYGSSAIPRLKLDLDADLDSYFLKDKCSGETWLRLPLHNQGMHASSMSDTTL